ncbi:cell division protein FtsQ/DivIB [Castellaniella caeni]|uniref:cell division protein FtsQ/DivIB n=1 Tax=Castellaniella caeni TaxID=266123 RepID=UPI00082F9552|nr:cell division protein FtsQ/DivIB [Castellaniella caeni]
MFADARLTNLIANLLALLAVLAMVAALVSWVIRRPYFAISRIEIEPMAGSSLQYVTPLNLQTALAGQVHGNFFLLNLDQVRHRIETAPWVRHAAIRRVWPATLLVKIEEQQPLALWNENQMINTWGEAFTANPGELPDDLHLPQLNGPASSERLVVQRYAEIARWFAPLGLSVREATLSPRYAWEVSLSDGVHLTLGRDPAADATDPHGRPGALPFAARIQRFVQAWPDLSRRLGGRLIASADLRYPNGFAITLAPETTATSRPSKP